MANITLRIRQDRINKQGTLPIEILIFHQGNNRTISLKRRVRAEHWDDVRKVVKGGDPREKQITNSIIKRETARLQSLIDKCLLKDERMDLSAIVSQYRGKKGDSSTLVDFLHNYIEANPKNLQFNTLRYYKTCLERLREFDLNVKLTDVDEAWLGRFEKFLKENGNSQNTVFNRLKVVRKMLRLARREGRINHYPFEYYTIRTEDTKRAFLSMEELGKLRELQGLPPSYELIRDIYVFSATTGGIRFGDLCLLSKDNIIEIKGDMRLEFRNEKTDDIISFRVPISSQQIISKYWADESDQVFPLLKDVPDKESELKQVISNANAYANKVLKILAKKAKISKRITMHTARHTWATISLNNDISTEVVGKILGHRNLKTTQIYTNILDKRKDEAIDKWDDILG